VKERHTAPIGSHPVKTHSAAIGVARGAKGSWLPQIFRKYSHFMLWQAFFQTK